MLVSSALGKVAPFVPVVGSAYGFGKTCIEVYSASSPSGAIVAGVKGVIVTVRLHLFNTPPYVLRCWLAVQLSALQKL
jgi:hypothetical protein